MRRRWGLWLLAVIAALYLGIAAYPVLAQSTGGSFGGGSFGGGGSYSGGGGGFSGGGFSGGGYSSGGSYSGRRGGGSLPCTCTFPFFVVFVIISLVVGQITKRNAIGGGAYQTHHGARGWNRVDISAIRLGIDWRARKEVQARLTQLAQSGQTGSPAGLANLLRETVLMLRRSELAWLYANVANYHPMSAASAEGIFRQLGMDARASFRHELVRNADGTTSRQDAPEMRAHAHEGAGVVVITLIVAAKREIIDIHDAGNADQLKRLLDDMVGVANPHSLVAMEVVWSPAAENDRMSTAELEQNYPNLKKIDERSIAGRIFCEYCVGPYAMELLKCPHCGAPAPTGRPRRHG